MAREIIRSASAPECLLHAFSYSGVEYHRMPQDVCPGCLRTALAAATRRLEIETARADMAAAHYRSAADSLAAAEGREAALRGENARIHTVAAHRTCKPEQCPVALLWYEWSNAAEALTECGYSDTAAREAAIACIERFDKWSAPASDDTAIPTPAAEPRTP